MFDIKDSYGDGISGAYGNGRFDLNVNITLVLKGGNFSFSETAMFGGEGGYTLTQEVDPTECYSFVVADAVGDGICCSFGNGSFHLFYGGVSVL